LQPANILLGPRLPGGVYSDIKLADFGLARFMNLQSEFNEMSGLIDNSKMTKECGTTAYMAPELLMGFEM
jgi:serine/threonine protein kinase